MRSGELMAEGEMEGGEMEGRDMGRTGVRTLLGEDRALELRRRRMKSERALKVCEGQSTLARSCRYAYSRPSPELSWTRRQ